jgi:hypothetical protein
MATRFALMDKIGKRTQKATLLLLAGWFFVSQ